jgi:cytoskeletal protein RodZ
MESAGVRLKKIRQEKGLSLEEVRKKTKIHLKILEAIEGDSLTNLNPVYLRGFLKIYCKFLGVEPKDYIPDYREAQSRVKKVTIIKDDLRSPFTKYVSFFKSAGVKLGAFRPSKKLKTTLRFTLIIIIISIALFNFGKFVSSKKRLPQTKQPMPVKIEKTGIQASPKAQAQPLVASQKPQPKQTNIAKENLAGIKLVILARENCWVDLKADGKVLFRRVLEKGRSESWQAKDKIELSLSNAGGVELQVNGQRFTNLGRKGQALRNIVITEKEGLRIP